MSFLSGLGSLFSSKTPTDNDQNQWLTTTSGTTTITGPGTVLVPSGISLASNQTGTITTITGTNTISSNSLNWPYSISIAPYEITIDKIEMTEKGLNVYLGNNTIYIISKDVLESFRKIMHNMNFNEKMDELLK